MKGKKVYMWFSTYHQRLEEFVNETLNEKEKEIFYMLWHSYGINKLINSCYFQIIRVGDKYHELQVSQYLQGQIKVLYTINREANEFEIFTKS